MAINNSINLAGGLPVKVDMGGTGAATFTQHGILLGNGTDPLAVSAALTDGQILIGDTGAAPVAATLTAGTGISITNGAGTITIAATDQTPWTEVTGTTQAMAANNSYIANNAAQVVLTLPVTAAVGDVITVTGVGAGGWQIAQNANQQIHFGNVSTASGVGGYLESTHQRDTVELVCVVANNEFNVIDAIGNITVL